MLRNRSKLILLPVLARLSVHVMLPVLALLWLSCSGSGRPDSKFKGVQVGVISYSWRSMPCSADDILEYCRASGISSIELMGDVAENFAGIPPMPEKPDRNLELTQEEASTYRKKVEEANLSRREWRINNDLSAYRELKKKFDRAGVGIHIVKFSPAEWSDEEVDYAFEAAKILGAGGVSNEIGKEACIRLGAFAGRHGMLAVFHNHLQPGNPDFSFREYLDYSPANMLNFDAGHYYGATGKDPSEILREYHDRIFSMHLKDKTGPDASPPNTNMVWGEGETPLGDILRLVRDEGWPIYCDIELEYNIPEGSDAVREVTRCVEYCREILMK